TPYSVTSVSAAKAPEMTAGVPETAIASAAESASASGRRRASPPPELRPIAAGRVSPAAASARSVECSTLSPTTCSAPCPKLFAAASAPNAVGSLAPVLPLGRDAVLLALRSARHRHGGVALVAARTRIMIAEIALGDPARSFEIGLAGLAQRQGQA